MNILKYLSIFLALFLTISQSSAEKYSVLDSVYKISYVNEATLITESSATSFIITGDNNRKYLLTNNHFCQSYLDNENTGFFFYENDKYVGSSEYIYSDSSKDLCLLTFNRQKIPSLDIRKKEARILEKVKIVGYPRGIGPIYTETFITGYIKADSLVAPDRVLFASEMIQPGHSGSPVLDKNNKVVGIVFAGYQGRYGTVIVLSSDIAAFLKEVE